MSNALNLTDPCTSRGISLSTPRPTVSGPYVAIGPISNFSTAITSCCSAYTNDSYVSSYAGGDASPSCYYYCSFNGTLEDMREVMACQKGAAEEKRRQQGGDGSGFLSIGSHPDLNDKPSIAAVGVESPRLGAWRSVVLGLAIFGAMAGAVW